MTGEVTDYLGDLMLRYEKAGAVRALVQLIPMNIGSAGDTFIASRVDKIRHDRARELFDALDRKGAVLTPAVIESEDFIHCFLVTSKAALNTRRREKIRLFARLLLSSISETRPRDTDDYEQMLQVLDDLTYTEWCALLILDRYSDRERQPSENVLQWSSKFWPDFQRDIEQELGIPPDEFTSFMSAIARTGLYEILAGGYLSYEGGVGFLTPRFHRLKTFVTDIET